MTALDIVKRLGPQVDMPSIKLPQYATYYGLDVIVIDRMHYMTLIESGGPSPLLEATANKANFRP